MVTHREAVKAAVDAGEIANNMVGADGTSKDEVDAFLFKAMLGAYLDARGLVMVPRKLMEAIAEGYHVSCASDTYICVENPDFKPDNGSDVNLVFDLGDDPFGDAP
jgi:hypothetical protein